MTGEFRGSRRAADNDHGELMPSQLLQMCRARAFRHSAGRRQAEKGQVRRVELERRALELATSSIKRAIRRELSSLGVRHRGWGGEMKTRAWLMAVVEKNLQDMRQHRQKTVTSVARDSLLVYPLPADDTWNTGADVPARQQTITQLRGNTEKWRWWEKLRTRDFYWKKWREKDS
jgi:hypothetical protein